VVWEVGREGRRRGRELLRRVGAMLQELNMGFMEGIIALVCSLVASFQLDVVRLNFLSLLPQLFIQLII
jgi:hypothetical protein